MKLKMISLFIAAFLMLNCGGRSEKYPEGDFHIMIISDVHISRDEEKDARLESLIGKLNSGCYPHTELLIVTGDVVSKVYSDKSDGVHLESSNNLHKLVRILDDLNMPYKLLMGNHDYKIDSDKDSDAPFSRAEIDTMEKIWKRFTGFDPYYSVNHCGWKFIMLNSMRGRYLNRNFDDEQLAWLEEELHSGMPVILFFHHPVKTDNFKIWGKPKDLITEDKEPRFFELCKAYNDQIRAVFVGHGHLWEQDILFAIIPVYETDSFGESDGFPLYIVGVDTLENTIRVSRTPLAGETM